MKIYLVLAVFISIFSCKKPDIKEEEQASDSNYFSDSEELYEARYHKLKYELYKQIQEIRHDKSIKAVIESLVLKQADSLLGQIKGFAEKFSEEEFGLSDEIIVYGLYVQKVPTIREELNILPLNAPQKQITADYLERNLKDSRILEPLIMLNSKLNSKDKFEIDKMHPSKGTFSKPINENDIYPIMYNLYLSNNQPVIYIVGNRIYKNQNQDKAIFYKRVLKLVLDKFHSNWVLSPRGTENWEISHEHLNPQTSIDNIYEAKSYYLENKIYDEMDKVYDESPFHKELVNNVLDKNIDLFVNKVDEYLKEFKENEGEIRELKIIAKHEQIIPYEKFVNRDYISIYAAIYNLYLSKFNPKICIVGKKSYPHQNKDYAITYNNVLVLDVRKFDSEPIDYFQFEIKKYRLDQVLEEQTSLTTDLIKSCNFCKLTPTSKDELDLREYILKRDVYNQIQRAKEDQDLINSLVLKQADALFRQIVSIIKKTFNDVEMDRNIYFRGVYPQTVLVDELKERLKNTKILQNPRISSVMDFESRPEQYNYIYPLIYNMYLYENNPVIMLYSKNYFRYELTGPWIACELLIDKSSDKWKVKSRRDTSESK
ncbi:hypothetical protein [Borrelia sp. RT1S]|uniref:hypothetical protein n=1 Tax=Borrelia sp. RT1S TaxID=2898580 RepID=UPI001E30C3EE|nr:hypothetical protein [Borrelia sp. RT1S]UGQ18024.1 hypothetical protein LSO05_06205 [Borrelia sp. RT1S]